MAKLQLDSFGLSADFVKGTSDIKIYDVQSSYYDEGVITITRKDVLMMADLIHQETH